MTERLPDSFSSTARPPWAVTAWTSESEIFIEIPSKEGPPYVMAFALTEGGLSKALRTMKDLHKEHKSPSYRRPEVGPRIAASKHDPEKLARAKAALRKVMGK